MLSKQKILTGTYVVLSMLATIPLMGSGCSQDGTFFCQVNEGSGTFLPDNLAGHQHCAQLQIANALKPVNNAIDQVNKFRRSLPICSP